MAGRTFGAILPTALVLLGIVSVQLGSAVAKQLFGAAGSFGTVALRLFFAAAVLMLVWRPSLRLNRRTWTVVLSYGVIPGLMNLRFYLALARIPLGIAVTTEFLGPLAVALAGSRRWLDAFWAVLAAGGVVLLMEGRGDLNLFGFLFALAAGTCLGWLTPDILAHLDDTPDFYLDQVAQVVMDRWSSGRVGLLGDAAFSSSPMSGQGTGLALVGAYLLAGELAAAGWDPDAGFARYEARMRSFVEANQEIGRLNARSRDVPGPDAEPRPDFASEWFTELVGRAINGIELPDYAEVPDSAAPAGSPITSSAKP